MSDWRGHTQKARDIIVVFIDVFDRPGTSATMSMDSMQRAIRSAQQALDDQPTMHRVLIFERVDRDYLEVDQLRRGEPSRIPLGPERKPRPVWLEANDLAERCMVSARTVERWARRDDAAPFSFREREDQHGLQRIYDWNVWKPWLIAHGWWDTDVDMACVPSNGGGRSLSNAGGSLGL